MTQRVNMKDAQDHLSDLIDAAMKGDEVFILTEDDQWVQLVPLTAQPRPFGSAKGLIEIADDFEAPLEDFEDYM